MSDSIGKDDTPHERHNLRANMNHVIMNS